MLRPLSLKKIDSRTLQIIWEDGHESLYDTTRLRENCLCAACKDEWTGESKLKPSQLPQTITPLTIDSVGQYGLKISFSDGHSTGIYTYDHLRMLCQCPSCAG